MPQQIEGKKLVKGKRCVVVAPSGYLKGRGERSGKFIESFDCVVKCTRTIEIADPDNELGKRCDIWYGLPYYPAISWNISFEALREHSVKLLYFQPRLERYAQVWDVSVGWFLNANETHQVPWAQACQSTYKTLIERLDSIPFTGVFAVMHLLNMGASEVFAYGFDFHQSGYFNDIESSRFEGSNWHKPEPQMAFLWELLQNEPRFDCDDNLKQLLWQRFGSELGAKRSREQLFNTDLQHFFKNQQESILLFRSCAIERFKPFLKGMESYFSAQEVHVLCQSECVSELRKFKANLIEYSSNERYNADAVLGIDILTQQRFKVCFIPYNGMQLLSYYQIFLITAALGIDDVYLISPRGALSKISNIVDFISKIERYMSMREEFRMLADKFDRKQCL